MKEGFKRVGDHNPVMTQRFGADPYALVYGDRVYLYMTGDKISYKENGEMNDNTYGEINTINVLSSADLVNWTDHGCVYAAGVNGAAKWGGNSWAPAAAYKEIDGKMKFFLYFANSGNGIAVLSADSPVGPFTDPIGKALISRDMKNCGDVAWLFDPAVLMDDDGNSYIYFGGGIPSPDMVARPGTARCAKLGADMTSIDGEVVRIENVPYLFEDSGINKINGKYVYSYCSNFNVPGDRFDELGFYSGEICTMVSDKPLGPFEFYKGILFNPENFFKLGGNNHHCAFNFKGQWYMSYHNRILEDAMGLAKGYRSTGINVMPVDAEGNIGMIEMDRAGVEQVCDFDPYKITPATTMAWMADVTTTQTKCDCKPYGTGETVLTGMSTGSWIGLAGVQFGDKPAGEICFTVSGNPTADAAISIRLDAPYGEEVAHVVINGTDLADISMTGAFTKTVTGRHDLFMVFNGEGYELKNWCVR